MSDFRIVVHTREAINRRVPLFSKMQKFLDSEVLRDCGPFVPFRTGNLMKSGDTGTVIGSGKVIYNAPYARSVYYALHANFSKEKHPDACAQWFEKAKALKKEDWLKGVRAIEKGG